MKLKLLSILIICSACSVTKVNEDKGLNFSKYIPEWKSPSHINNEASWAICYYALTIQNNIKLNRSVSSKGSNTTAFYSKNINDYISFSPFWIYNQKVENPHQEMQPIEILEALIEQGTPTFQNFSSESKKPDQDLVSLLKSNEELTTIKSYNSFKSDDDLTLINLITLSLQNKKPIVIKVYYEPEHSVINNNFFAYNDDSKNQAISYDYFIITGIENKKNITNFNVISVKNEEIKFVSSKTLFSLKSNSFFTISL